MIDGILIEKLYRVNVIRDLYCLSTPSLNVIYYEYDRSVCAGGISLLPNFEKSNFQIEYSGVHQPLKIFTPHLIAGG